MEFFNYLLPETPENLARLDLSLHIIHSGLVLFMIFSLFCRRLIPVHFYLVVIIWTCWIGRGLYVGHLGYCPLTDWHWQVKYREGQVELPGSYITYIFDNLTGIKADNKLVANLTAAAMTLITLASTYRYIKCRTSITLSGPKPQATQ